MSTPPPSINRAPRYACNYFGYMEVLFPEETFTPKSYYIQLIDISLTGCRILSKAVPPDIYRLMLVEQRHARLAIDLTDRRTLRLKGRIVWIDYKKDTAALAISFTGLNDADLISLERVLDEMHREGSILNLEDTRPGVRPVAG